MSKMISVIIPTYNRKKKLCECIDSILNQNYKKFEIIVIDDGSNDDTAKIIQEKYGDIKNVLYFVNEKNSGAGYSRKRGYEISKGDYIIFCDDDDFYTDMTYFKKAVEIFKNENVKCIFSNSHVWYEKENKYILNELNFKSGISTIEYLEKFQFNYLKPNSTFTAIFRRNILNENGFMDVDMVNDSSIYMRALIGNGSIHVIEDSIGVYRIHSQNITFNIKCDFLLLNLDEKKKIYEIVKRKKLFEKYDTWFNKQIKLTCYYYLFNSMTTFKERCKLYKWIIRNSSFGITVVIVIIVKFILFKIKKIINYIRREKNENI